MKSMNSVWSMIILVLFSTYCLAQNDAERFTGLINQYCATCHNDALRTAGFSLQQADFNNIGEHTQTWEKVLRKIKVKTMPPSGMPRPDDATYEAFANFLTTSLDNYAKADPRPGVAAIRRLNRTEYFNAIRDILAIEINDSTILPADDTMYGFDNVGAVLTLSPMLAEQYITAGRKMRFQALGHPDMPPEFFTYTAPRYLMQDDWVSDELPFGSRGGMAIQHHFPMDGEYVLQIRLQKNSRDYIRGLTHIPHEIDVRLDDQKIARLSVGGEKFAKSSGIFSSSAQGAPDAEEYQRYSDESLEVRFNARAGTRKISVAFLKKLALPEEPDYSRMSIIDYAQLKAGVPGIGDIRIGGPFNAAVSKESDTRKKVYVCEPRNDSDTRCAEQIISSLGRLAYRRTLSKDELKGLMEFFQQGRRAGGFDEGIGLAMERILAGPKFLFVAEQAPKNVKEGEVFAISDLELATRLSLFLWSSIPDNELLTVAESGQLRKPEVLNVQIKRMLSDPRSRTLVNNFAAQWLSLGRLNASAPNGEIFPYFDDNLRQAFRKETEMFFDYVFRNDKPLLELLDADYTFVNERLAKHYGIPDVFGNHFRKVDLTDGTRGGLLGQGSILTVTSYGNRTAPTIRGKWILENIRGAPPPPPPANVPGLRDKNDEGKVLNMRQQMEQHRANPVCASCHKVMDPLGFALENYDAIGKWRTVDAASKSPIDPSGALPDGTPFEGLSGLKQVLIEKRQYDFIMSAIERMLTYALGRGINHQDAPAMRAIMKQSEPDNYRLSSIIMSIIESMPFQMRRAPDHDDI
jgi:hypothetical protein